MNLPAFAAEGGGKSFEFGGKAIVIDVDADAYDRVAQHCRCFRLRGDGGGLDQNAAALFVVDQEIVGPANIGVRPVVLAIAVCAASPVARESQRASMSGHLRAQKDAE